MEFYKKIKQKIEDELTQEDEDEPEQGQEDDEAGSSESRVVGAAYQTPEAENRMLRQEISTLKEHINRNYAVYVKRLEKRKAKIKELEDNTKLILNENDSLSQKLDESEGKYIVLEIN